MEDKSVYELFEGMGAIVNKFFDEYTGDRKKEEPQEKTYKFTSKEKSILINVSKHYKYIARDEDNMLYAYAYKPFKSDDGWDGTGCSSLNAFEHLFKCVKWSDEEPCEFRKYI